MCPRPKFAIQGLYQRMKVHFPLFPTSFQLSREKKGKKKKKNPGCVLNCDFRILENTQIQDDSFNIIIHLDVFSLLLFFNGSPGI